MLVNQCIILIIFIFGIWPIMDNVGVAQQNCEKCVEFDLHEKKHNIQLLNLLFGKKKQLIFKLLLN